MCLTALHVACEKGRTGMISSILRAGKKSVTHEEISRDGYNDTEPFINAKGGAKVIILFCV